MAKYWKTFVSFMVWYRNIISFTPVNSIHWLNHHVANVSHSQNFHSGKFFSFDWKCMCRQSNKKLWFSWNCFLCYISNKFLIDRIDRRPPCWRSSDELIRKSKVVRVLQWITANQIHRQSHPRPQLGTANDGMSSASGFRDEARREDQIKSKLS